MSPLSLIAASGLLLFLCLGSAAFYFHQSAVEKNGQLSQLQADLNASQATLALQVFQFQRVNEITAKTAAYQLTLSARSEERQHANRQELKTEACADHYIPDATAQRLHDYTHRLRARALRDPHQPDGTLAGAAAPRRMTYRQAVLWLDPLLTLLDRANHDRESLRNLPSPHHGKT
ncbi:DUF2570 domain-containing protein [Yersinia artesiana]|uniref:DUF2570 domain-containing protein n=1 Tax=Yersinia artesiana TaxID=2890315 RepID=UPI00158168C6|nr:DUF2570 domain-containing protein [Yersinia artesiana]